MSPFRGILGLLSSLREAKKATADVLRLDEEIRKRRISAAADLDHAFLAKIIATLKPDVMVRIFLRSGETVEISQADKSPRPQEGPGW